MRKRNARYKEIALPLTKITSTGGCLAILIRKSMIKKHGLKAGDKVIPTLLIRSFKPGDEMLEVDEKELDEQLKKEREVRKEQKKTEQGYRRLTGSDHF